MADTTFGTSTAALTPSLTIENGQVTTTSLQIAEHFGKRHADVIRAIKSLLLEVPEGYQRNFAPIQIDVDLGMGRTRKDPAYRITRDGFTLLAMGFTGKEALQWKLAYIAAFNNMEQELLARKTLPHNPAIDYDRISPAQAQDLKELVHAIVDAKVQGFAETWARLHKRFRVNSYLELPVARFEEARDYLLGKLPTQAQPVSDTSRMQAAFETAAQAVAAVQKTVFNAVMAGDDGWRYDRWILAYGNGTDNKPSIPQVLVVERDAVIMSLAQLAEAIMAPGGMMPSNQDLAKLGAACLQRLSTRLNPPRA